MIILIINIIIALTIDYLSFKTVSKGRVIKSKTGITTLKALHVLLSLLTYLLIIRVSFYRGDFAENKHIYLLMMIGLLISAVWIPRIIIIILSNLAFLISKKSIRLGRIVNTFTQLLASISILLIISGSLFGRFNFNYNEVEINFQDLPEDLKGLKIVHLSDMHLSSFYKHEEKLISVMERINMLEADLIINTGDFVTIGWNEMYSFADILSRASARYGSYAIPGNHDAGSYHPYYSEEDRLNNVRVMDSLLLAAGYIQLKDSSLIINIDSASIKIAGVITTGSIPDIFFGDLDKALDVGNEADFTILLSHDPNHWYRELSDRNDIDLTLSGHTHGMQLGIEIGTFQWSPASLLYPAWAGLYESKDNFLYVNRGLGTISLPFRIGMPPEITVLTLN